MSISPISSGPPPPRGGSGIKPPYPPQAPNSPIQFETAHDAGVPGFYNPASEQFEW